MSVVVTYGPLIYLLRDDATYEISWESAGKSDIEAYWVYRAADETEEGRRERLRPQDYNITYRKQYRSAINESGRLRTSLPPPDWATHVAIERNTLIDQTVDFPDASAFNGRMIEYALDKHTMIAQELASRKCTALTSIPITQEITFTQYDDLKASVVNFAVNKLINILREISQTAIPCVDGEPQ